MSSAQQCDQEFLLQVQTMMISVAADVNTTHAMAQDLKDVMEPKWLGIYRINGPSILILSEYIATQSKEQIHTAATYPSTHTETAEDVYSQLTICKDLCACILEKMQTKKQVDNISIRQLWYELQWISKFIFTKTPFYINGTSPLASMNYMTHINDIRKSVNKLRHPVHAEDLMCTEDPVQLASPTATQLASPTATQLLSPASPTAPRLISPTAPLTPTNGADYIPEGIDDSPRPNPPCKPAPVPLRLDTNLPPLALPGRTHSYPSHSRTHSRPSRTLTWASPPASPRASRSRSPRR
jgi:hypothetical protein